MVGQSHVMDLVSSGSDVWPWHVGQKLQARLKSSVMTIDCGDTVRHKVVAEGFVLLQMM